MFDASNKIIEKIEYKKLQLQIERNINIIKKYILKKEEEIEVSDFRVNLNINTSFQHILNNSQFTPLEYSKTETETEKIAPASNYNTIHQVTPFNCSGYYDGNDLGILTPGDSFIARPLSKEDQYNDNVTPFSGDYSYITPVKSSVYPDWKNNCFCIVEETSKNTKGSSLVETKQQGAEVEPESTSETDSDCSSRIFDYNRHIADLQSPEKDELQLFNLKNQGRYQVTGLLGEIIKNKNYKEANYDKTESKLIKYKSSTLPDQLNTNDNNKILNYKKNIYKMYNEGKLSYNEITEQIKGIDVISNNHFNVDEFLSFSFDNSHYKLLKAQVEKGVEIYSDLKDDIALKAFKKETHYEAEELLANLGNLIFLNNIKVSNFREKLQSKISEIVDSSLINTAIKKILLDITVDTKDIYMSNFNYQRYLFLNSEIEKCLEYFEDINNNFCWSKDSKENADKKNSKKIKRMRKQKRIISGKNDKLSILQSRLKTNLLEVVSLLSMNSGSKSIKIDVKTIFETFSNYNLTYNRIKEEKVETEIALDEVSGIISALTFQL